MSTSTTHDETTSKAGNTTPSPPNAQKIIMAAIGRAGWAGYQTLIYANDKPVDTLDLARLEREAKETLGHGAFYYVNGSAGVSATYDANLKALREWKIIPRMLAGATKRDLSVTLFGTKYTSPVIIAPIGVQGIIHADAELATARATKALGIPITLSTAATRSIENVAEANGDGNRWFQLYWPKSDDITASLLKRAKESGYKVLVVTLDTTLVGWRPHDLQTSYLPFKHGVGCAVGFSDPVFMSRYNLPTTHAHNAFPYSPNEIRTEIVAGGEKSEGWQKKMALSMAWMGEVNSGIFRTWEDLELLKKHWDGPIVLKGIQSVADAEKAVQVGVQGIVVSNHGGRQVDGAIGSLAALERIFRSSIVKEAQASKDFTVLFDSGIRYGSDIIKAVALGAQGVMVGRPYVYGLAKSGQEGVEAVLRALLADLDVSLGLAGYSGIAELHHKAGKMLVHERE